MTSGDTHDTSAAAAVLDAVREDRRDADSAEARLLRHVLAWAELHVTEDPDAAETWDDSPIRLGGQGVPWIREFTVTELATALRLSPVSGRLLVAEVMELAFRLPRLWARVQAGQVVAWRARQVAAKTQQLSVDAATFVDGRLADSAGRMGARAVERLVDEAVGRFMPRLAEEQRAAAEERQHVGIGRNRPSYAGTVLLEGELDLADAMDLDAALNTIAAELKERGDAGSLDQRRARALGELARRQLRFRFHYDEETDQVTPHLVEEAHREPVPAPGGPARSVMLYAHLPAYAIDHQVHGGIQGSESVLVEGHGGQLVTLDTLREWLGVEGRVEVTVRPVLDLNATLTSNGRFATDAQQEQLVLRDRTCAAPHCDRPARRLDADHIQAWVDPGEGGPPGQTAGQTSSDNLAKLCRHHHRSKTFTDWDYTQLYPGVFYWTSPHGLRFLTCAGQTIDLN